MNAPYDQEELKQHLTLALALESAERHTFLADLRQSRPELAPELTRLLGAADTCFLGDGIDAVPAHHAKALPAHVRKLGAYELVRKLGHGGMGMVFLASRADGAYDASVAIKLIDPATAGSSAGDRFRREWRIQASLEHSNIVRLLDVGTSDGLLYLVMEYVEGMPIDRYCTAQALSRRDRLILFLQVCGGLTYAHSRLVIHRDIKPSNVLVSLAGVPKLIDFGIAGLANASGSSDVTGTRMTPRYASPEQLAGEEWIGTSSDIYSLGVLCMSS
jgi:serine/threonine protein kinase